MFIRHFYFLLVLLFSLPAHAEYTLVLIHGYLGEGHTWRQTGIVSALEQAGWQDRGHLWPHKMISFRDITDSKNNYIYTVTLPPETALASQSEWLAFYLQYLQKRHPTHSLVLVGHSVGGVVARLCMVTYDIAVEGLITIATPHLGTDKAEWGLWLNQSPFSWITPFLGLSTINRSGGLYWDLVRENPMNLLFWLNRQVHPAAFYVSIIRLEGEQWVPPYSQDMNNVVALRGQAQTFFSVGAHHLHPIDGPNLARLLDHLLFNSDEY